MLKLATAVGAVLLVSMAVPAAAPAVTQIPPDGGVTGRLVDGNIASLRFSPAAFRKLAGKRVVIACTEMGEDEGPGIYSEGIGSEAFRMPKRRRVVRRYVGPNNDYCTLRRKGRNIITFATSDRGAIVVDEQYGTSTLMTMLLVAVGDAQRYRTADELAAATAFPFTPLAAPADTPPAGSVGYYSDGNLHAAAVILSAAGRRLYLEVDADDVLRTNVSRYLFNDIY
jgi:hypothetical protein